MANTAYTDGIYGLTIPVVMTWPNLFEARQYKENGIAKGEPKFSADFIFTPDNEDMKAIKTLVGGLAKNAWPDRPFFLTTVEGVKIPNIALPWKSGNERADKLKTADKPDDHLRDKIVLKASSKHQPVLAYIKNGKKFICDNPTALASAKDKFYNGVKVYAEFNFAIREKKGDSGIPGITAYLNGVLSTCEGTKLSGGRSATDMFKGYVGSVSAEDPTAPGAGEDLDDLM